MDCQFVSRPAHGPRLLNGMNVSINTRSLYMVGVLVYSMASCTDAPDSSGAGPTMDAGAGDATVAEDTVGTDVVADVTEAGDVGGSDVAADGPGSDDVPPVDADGGDMLTDTPADAVDDDTSRDAFPVDTSISDVAADTAPDTYATGTIEPGTHDCVEDRYTPLRVTGWDVCVETTVLESSRISEAMMAALASDLARVSVEVEPAVLGILQGVRIWVEADADWPGGVYHPSATWLTNNGYPAHWARSVQVGNASNYVAWRAIQPAIVLHELAHAWHHQQLGYDHPGIRDAYEAAMARGEYTTVAYAGGGYAEAYATVDEREYFAELSEAWFWTNDFEPFTRAELEVFDPGGAAVIEDAWHLD